MSLTKKHFEALAGILARHATSYELATEVANFCAGQNPNFDRMAFLTTVGVQITEQPKPRPIYVTAASYDWNEFAMIHRTAEDAMVSWHEQMKLHHEPDAPSPGTDDWYQALSDAYENDKWKAYEVYAFDLTSMDQIAVSRDMIDWSEVADRVNKLDPTA